MSPLETLPPPEVIAYQIEVFLGELSRLRQLYCLSVEAHINNEAKHLRAASETAKRIASEIPGVLTGTEMAERIEQAKPGTIDSGSNE